MVKESEYILHFSRCIYTVKRERGISGSIKTLRKYNVLLPNYPRFRETLFLFSETSDIKIFLCYKK